MKWLMILTGVCLVAALAGMTYVRSAAHDPDRWHVNPTDPVELNGANQFLGAQVFDADPTDVAARLKRALGGTLLAGDFGDGFVTVVVRTPLIGYPDYVSVRITEEGGGSRVTLYSRSRFGYSDLGANKTRVKRVFAVLAGS